MLQNEDATFNKPILSISEKIVDFSKGQILILIEIEPMGKK